jgi:hypothetical protein
VCPIVYTRQIGRFIGQNSPNWSWVSLSWLRNFPRRCAQLSFLSRCPTLPSKKPIICPHSLVIGNPLHFHLYHRVLAAAYRTSVRMECVGYELGRAIPYQYLYSRLVQNSTSTRNNEYKKFTRTYTQRVPVPIGYLLGRSNIHRLFTILDSSIVDSTLWQLGLNILALM